ncbi:MAG: hypothetical protein DI587_27090 [Variovorax paradoxus]|nr:MAG: hypothetical protein DI583_27090 [Variovorax paradoxus]PZQ04440.1 MAG: hypothetical protein DI587_27090 [Variovorax paradoxus]
MQTAQQARAGRALAVLVTANGRLDARALAALDRLQAFERLALDRQRFVEVAHACAHDLGAQLCECSWLRDHDMACIDAWLDPQLDPQTRLLICRMAFAAIASDGCVSDDERLVFEHVLARWHVDMADLLQWRDADTALPASDSTPRAAGR